VQTIQKLTHEIEDFQTPLKTHKLVNFHSNSFGVAWTLLQKVTLPSLTAALQGKRGIARALSGRGEVSLHRQGMFTRRIAY